MNINILFVCLFSEERYLGMWKEDRYHGAGILIASNKYHFSGDFVNGERTVSSEADIHTHYVCDVCMCVLCNNSTATGIIGMC